MKKVLVGLFALYAVCGGMSSVSAQTDAAPKPPEERPPDAASGKRAREFQGDDVGQVLRLLARQAKVDLAVGEAVKGTVSLRLENSTAFDAIEVVVRQNKLLMTKDEKGVYYVNAPEPANTALDLLAKPETADRMATYVRNFYNALTKQGFQPEEAMHLTEEIRPETLLDALAPRPEPVPPK